MAGNRNNRWYRGTTCFAASNSGLAQQMTTVMSKKKEGRRICKCECGGEVRGIDQFGQLFTWCEKCTPVEKVKLEGAEHERS